MNIAKSKAVLHRRALKLALTGGLAIASIPMIETAHAGILPVVDFTAATQWWQGYAEQIAEWSATVAQFKSVLGHQVEEIRHWESQLNQLRQINFELMKIERTFNEIDKNLGVEVECQGKAASGGLDNLVDTAIGQLLPDLDGDVIEEQRKLCIQIVQSQNTKYNENVKYLRFVKNKMAEMEEMQTKLVEEAKKTSGNTAGLQQQLAQYGQILATARANWQSSQQLTDLQISILTSQQARFSRRALNGAPSLVGTVVNSIALKAALSK